MIAAEFDVSGPGGRIVLQPNRSLTWRANTLLVATLLTVSGTIGLVLALRGLWLVLPFVLLECGVLLACLYYCVRRTHMQEVLTFSPEYLVFERGVTRPEVQCRFQRYFTRFSVSPPPHPGHRKRICLRCRGTELEVGSFLTSEEQEDLVTTLRRMIARLDHPAGRALLR